MSDQNQRRHPHQQQYQYQQQPEQREFGRDSGGISHNQQHQHQHTGSGFPSQAYADLQAASMALPLPAIPTDPSSAGATAQQQQQAATKQGLKTWWTKFTKQQQAAQAQAQAAAASGSGSSNRFEISPTSSNSSTGAHYKGVFGVPLTESLKYAGVAISMVGPDGVNQVYGYIPIVVAKCGLFLKQKATTVEGVFRISGSTRRMKELQDIFDRPPSYGKDVVWGPWSVHDAANVLRRYLNQLPEPVVPAELYEDFRNALPQLGKIDNAEAIEASIERYKVLVAQLPASTKYLLSYVLDMLNVFAKNHQSNLMPASNLAVVFQPGLIRAPEDAAGDIAGIPIPGAASIPGASESLSPPNMTPLSRSSSNPSALQAAMMSTSISDGSSSGAGGASNNTKAELTRRQDEIKINQEVLEFLINHQDHFVVFPDQYSSASSAPPSSTDTSPVSPTSKQGLPSQAAQNSGSQRPQQQQNQPSLPQQQQQSQAPIRPQQPIQPLQQPNAMPMPASQKPTSIQSSSTQTPSTSLYSSTPASQQGKAAQIPSQTARSREANKLPPISTAAPPVLQTRTAHWQPSTASFPVMSPPATARSSKEKEREKEKDRQPRKLKKGRTPTSSGVATPTTTGASQTVIWDPSNPETPYLPRPLRSSSPYTATYDDDIPLSATTVRGQSLPPSAGSGATVKRSRTLPGSSPSPRANSPRSVGRRQSESRTSSPPTVEHLLAASAGADNASSVSDTASTSSPIFSFAATDTIAPNAPAAGLLPLRQNTGDLVVRDDKSSISAKSRARQALGKASTGTEGNAGFALTDQASSSGYTEPSRLALLLAEQAGKIGPDAASAIDVADMLVLPSSYKRTDASGSIAAASVHRGHGLAPDISKRRPSTTSSLNQKSPSSKSFISSSPGSSHLHKIINPPPQPRPKEERANLTRQEARKLAEEEEKKTANAIRNAVANAGR